MFATRLIAALVLTLAGASIALACGPFFPWQLLENRNDTLKTTPANSFAFEAQHLVAPVQDHLKPDEQSFDETAQADELGKAAVAGLSAAQIEMLSKTKDAATGDEAFATGAGLPGAIRLYRAGAVDFRKVNLPAAKARFDAVLALPPAAQRLRSVWAAYMLGRTDALAGDADGAVAAFRQTRTLAAKGLPDPLGLAVASFGAEARLHWDRATSELVLNTPPKPANSDGSIPVDTDEIFKGYDLPPQNAETFGREMAQAVDLYAVQAAHGSNSGVQSLRIVAGNLLSDPARVDATIANARIQRLLVVYALALLQDVSQQDGRPDAGTRDSGVSPNPVLQILVSAIQKHGIAHPAAVDQLAALCYRIGRYDLAASLANKSSSPLAQWVLAKLAIQQGDLALAAKYYANASKGFPTTKSSGALDDDSANRVVGESGVVALARGEYVDALDKLYPVANTYWGDVAYIAERVLTVDELKTYVDAKVPTSPATPKKSDGSYPWISSNPATMLRNLLARRLVREGRLAEALGYFADSNLRAQAQSYETALADAKTDWGRVDRAQAWFKAAKLARESGMDIMGYEEAPDFNFLSGSYDSGVGQTDPHGPYVGKEERVLYNASTAQPNLRFHYRYIALDEAKQAAALLPPRSQAYAAVLCHASRWMMDTQGEQARARCALPSLCQQWRPSQMGHAFWQPLSRARFCGSRRAGTNRTMARRAALRIAL